VGEEEGNFWELCARKEENKQVSFAFAWLSAISSGS